MARRFTLWDPDTGNVSLPTALNETFAAGSGISIDLDTTTGIITITAQDQVDDFASPPPLGDVVPNTVAATTLNVTGNAVLATTQVTGLTVLQTANLQGLTATALAVSSASVLHTAQVGGLTDTQTSNLAALNVAGNSVLHTTQITGLTVSSLANTGTVVANGASLVTANVSGLTANSLVILTLKTIGGTVGAVPAIVAITPPSVFVIKGTALDTSTYNYAILG